MKEVGLNEQDAMDRTSVVVESAPATLKRKKELPVEEVVEGNLISAKSVAFPTYIKEKKQSFAEFISQTRF